MSLVRVLDTTTGTKLTVGHRAPLVRPTYAVLDEPAVDEFGHALPPTYGHPTGGTKRDRKPATPTDNAPQEETS